MPLKTRDLKPHNSHNDDHHSTSVVASTAANQGDDILDPAVLAEVWSRRAYILAEKPPDIATGQTTDILIFRLGNERYGIDVANVREIYPLEQLTPVPRTPKFVAGVFSARGRILSVIDLRMFLGLAESGLSDQTKIMVVTNTNPTSDMISLEVGLLADEVVDVLTLFKEEIQPSLTTHTATRAEYIQGITADLLTVLNLNNLLNDRQLIIHEEIV